MTEGLKRGAFGSLVVLTVGASVLAAQGPPASPQAPVAAPQGVTVTVVGTTPAGSDVAAQDVPAPVQGATAADLEHAAALDVTDFLNRRFGAVHVNEVQGNPYQADVNYRGYTASPLLGSPQGLSVYMDGVRLNQPFGDVVSWDLIPRNAVDTVTLMPGSNPLFGRNTLGGALALRTKSGRTSPGTSVQATYGSSVRRALEFEHGGARASGFDWFVAGTLFAEDGWRQDSPSDVRQLFGKFGWERAAGSLTLSVVHADNALTGNGLQETGFLDRDYASVYTKPDETDQRATGVTLTGSRRLRRVELSGNAHYRGIRTSALNGDLNEASLDQALYQPSAVEIGVLQGANYAGVPLGGATAANTPFPSWRCIANVLLNDEPAEKCNAVVNRTTTRQHSAGASAQLVRRDGSTARGHQLTIGVAYDRGRAAFAQSTQLGYLNPDRSVTTLPAFADGVTGGTEDGVPFDTRVDLDGLVQTVSVYAAEALALGRGWHVSLSGRYDRTAVRNRDAITPGGGPDSLDGDHTFARFNPAAGVVYRPSTAWNLYAGYSEASRAATAIELGCANPERPCKLPNAMAGDPPLAMVVARTWETGARGRAGTLDWSAGFFHGVNHDDIQFVVSEQAGFGYFTNVGRTRRQGLELSASRRTSRLEAGASYTWLDATFQSEETVNGSGNSSNDEAAAGAPGFEGSIDVQPGDRIPLVPAHLLKVFAGVQASGRLRIDADVLAVSSSYARGNENNRHQPLPPYYLGAGVADGYAVVGLSARYQLLRGLQVFAQVNNLFDRRFATAAQLGPNGFTESGAFVARPLPAIGGAYPVVQSTFLAPGAPRRAWVGTRVTF